MFARCAALRIPATTVAPLGMGAALLNFIPGRMSFSEYFGFHRCRQDEKPLRFLHGMAAEVINEDGLSRAAREEPIWELAEMISSDVCEFTDRLKQVHQTAEELEKLAPRDDWDEEDDEENGENAVEEENEDN